MNRRHVETSTRMVDGRCTQIADVIVPEYRGGKKSYSCTGVVAKRWQVAWDGACLALGHAPKCESKPGLHRCDTASEAPRSCSVVDSIDCECPPNGMIGDPPPVICHACGDDVCRNCSTLITYHKRRCRVCFNCQDTRKIGRSSPASDAAAAAILTFEEAQVGRSVV